MKIQRSAVVVPSMLGLLLSLTILDSRLAFAVQETQTETTTQEGEDAIDDESPLMTLDWLVGEWAVDREDSAESEGSGGISVRYTKNNSFLILSFSFARETEDNMAGMQVIAWDPAEKHIRSWTYDSNGGFGQDTWRQQGSLYTIRTRYTLADGGKASSLKKLQFIDDDTFTLQTINREIDGKLMPDKDPVTMTRQSTEVQSETSSEPNTNGANK